MNISLMRDCQGVDIVIFARYWVTGQVKTRLCPPLSYESAAALQQCALDLLAARLQGLSGATVIIAYEPPESRRLFASRYPHLLLLPQHGAGLSEKLQHLLAARDAPCLFTGNDCPTVPLEYFLHAAGALRAGADVVLGPADDGGSYILGCALHCADWFTGVAWSTDTVADALRARARQRGWRMHELPRWYDVDRGDDLKRLLTDVKILREESATVLQAVEGIEHLLAGIRCDDIAAWGSSVQPL